jgi:hypothetical protein
MADDKSKLLRLMRFWLIGTFLILLAAVLIVGLQIPGLFSEPRFWIGVGVIAVLCGAWYFIYKWYIGRKQE